MNTGCIGYLKAHPIAPVQQLKRGLKLVIAIVPFPRHVKEQVQLCGTKCFDHLFTHRCLYATDES